MQSISNLRDGLGRKRNDIIGHSLVGEEELFHRRLGNHDLRAGVRRESMQPRADSDTAAMAEADAAEEFA